MMLDYDRGQKTEDRRQKAEDRIQKTEDRGQNSSLRETERANSSVQGIGK